MGRAVRSDHEPERTWCVAVTDSEDVVNADSLEIRLAGAELAKDPVVRHPLCDECHESRCLCVEKAS